MPRWAENETEPLFTPEPTEFLFFLKEHFAAISTIAIVGGVVVSTIFLYSYLDVFDWHLFWVVEYQDILTFALVAVGILGASFGLYYNAMNALFRIGLLSGNFNKNYLFAVCIVAIGLLGIQVLSETKENNPDYQHILWGWTSFAMLIAGCILIAELITNRAFPKMAHVGWLVFFLLIGANTMGVWLAHSVMASRNTVQDVYLKGQTITGVKVVMVTSHHTILSKDNQTVVVPTEDIKQIVGRHY